MDCFSYYGHPNSSKSSSVENNGSKMKGNGKRSKVVKLSTDPQSVRARERRHRISDRFKILQSLVPGGTKMDTVSILEETIHYVKFLKSQIWLHQKMISFMDDDPSLFLDFLPPSTLPAQQSFYSLDSLVASEVHLSQPFGLPDSHFQSEETKPFDGTMNY